jgi:TPR repeat protein
MRYYGNCFEKGYSGKIDPKEAMIWYRKAAELGHPEAMKKNCNSSNWICLFIWKK